MSAKVTILNKARQHYLFQQRGLPVGDCLDRRERIHQMIGNHEIAQPKRRMKYLAEGPHVKNTAKSVKPLQGWQRTPLISKLAVVVVLEDPCTVLVRPIKERQAPSQRQSSTERILV